MSREELQDNKHGSFLEEGSGWWAPYEASLVSQ